MPIDHAQSISLAVTRRLRYAIIGRCQGQRLLEAEIREQPANEFTGLFCGANVGRCHCRSVDSFWDYR